MPRLSPDDDFPPARRLAPWSKLAALALLGWSTAGLAQPQPASSPAAAIEAIAPALSDYTSRVLFGDVWKRQELPARDRSLITLSALVTTGKLPQLGRHIARALDNGVTPAEVVAVIVHVGFYSGWPNASSGIEVADRVFQERKVDRSALRRADRRVLPPLAAESTRPLFGQQQVASVAPKLTQLTDQVLHGELWRRADLSRRDRSLVTIASLVADGPSDQLADHFRFARANGLSREEIGEAITHLAFYAGWPKAMAAARVAQDSLAR